MKKPEDRPSSSSHAADSLEAGLAAGFGAPTDRGRRSVVAFLEEQLGSSLNLSLPDPDSEDEPVVTGVGNDRTADVGTRYAVLGEIARGGLGVVLKGRDLDLGRDVAMKVLHERFKNDRQVIERFVEEAQIGGQLQHPGIVPVYEMGLQADDRPFFAMKLVKGQTLAEKLQRRASPPGTDQNLLRVFLQVCQTVAYAHARRVVHRDLKPSNIMVGAFGEVQVVDWGLAKVLRRGGVADERCGEYEERGASVIETVRSAEGSRPSIAGSVMGTPAYMPPEQARGEVAHMDERSDVFALGAVLCEVLTGKPPYDVGDQAVALRDAADCRQEAALERLGVCGAEGALVDLVQACLSPAREGRPADAGEVARRIEAHLQTTEQRARSAEVRAAELRVRARSTLAIAAVVVLSLLIGGGSWLTLDGQRRERLRETEDLADAAVLEATRWSGQAEMAGLGGVGLWSRAVGAAQRAGEIVAAGTAGPELTEHVQALVTELEEREDETRAQALREEAHRVLLARLREVRVGPEVLHWDFRKAPERRARESARRDAEYAALLAELGIDGRTEAASVRDLLACEHRADFALALDAWAEARRVAATCGADLQPEDWRRPVRLARALDPDDPWRSSLRDELSRETLDVAGLRALATPGALSARSADEIALVVGLLEAAGELEAAIGANLEGLRRHPSDFGLNMNLGDLCLTDELTGRRYQVERNGALSAMISLRPGSRRARYASIGDSFMNLDSPDDVARELVLEDPEDPISMTLHYILLMERGRFEEAGALLPDSIPALQASEWTDWDYFGFVTMLGHGERLLESPAVELFPLLPVPLFLHLGRYEEAFRTLAEHESVRRSAYPRHSLELLREARSPDELRGAYEELLALGSAGPEELRSISAEEALAAAELLESGWQDLLAVVRLHEHAFELDPATKEIWRWNRARHHASAVAALASAGLTPGTTELDAAERRALRGKSRAWLHEELDAIIRDIADPDSEPEYVLRVSQVLHQLQVYGWHAPIREPEYLARMTDEEAHACRVVWARVHGVHAMLDALMATSP